MPLLSLHHNTQAAAGAIFALFFSVKLTNIAFYLNFYPAKQKIAHVMGSIRKGGLILTGTTPYGYKKAARKSSPPLSKVLVSHPGVEPGTP